MILILLWVKVQNLGKDGQLDLSDDNLLKKNTSYQLYPAVFIKG